MHLLNELGDLCQLEHKCTGQMQWKGTQGVLKSTSKGPKGDKKWSEKANCGADKTYGFDQSRQFRCTSFRDPGSSLVLGDSWCCQ